MKLSSVVLAALLATAACPRARAQDAVDFELAVVSQYLWRGFDLGQGYDPNGGDNHLHWQPSVNYATDSGWSFNFWGSYGSDGNANFDEVNVTLDYSFAATDSIDVSLGHIFYDFPSTNASSAEFYAGATWNDAPFAPSLFVYHDYDTGDGWYAELGLGHDFVLPDSDLGLGAGLTVGYNGSQWGARSGISNVALSLGTELPLSNGWTLSPSLTYVLTPGNRVNTEDEFVAALALAKSL